MPRDDTPRFLENYLAYLLAKTSHQISSEFHQRLRSLGISISHWRVLAVLHDGECSVGALAEKVLLNQPTMSKTLDKMEAEGLIERRRNEGDLRTVRVQLTALGREQVGTLIPLANAHEAAAFEHLSDHDKQHLIRMLQSTMARSGQR